MSASPLLLLADIGGTNARFALHKEGRLLHEPAQWLAALHTDLPSAMNRFMEERGLAMGALDGVAVCGAGPVKDGRIALTNSPWTVDRAEIAAITGDPEPVVVNDFTAMAMGVVKVGPGDRQAIPAHGPSTLDPSQPIGVLGPGTGLGVSGLVPDGHGGLVPLSGEGGHVDLTAQSEREIAVLFQLMQSHGHVSAETVLCGPGLETLYAALAGLAGRPAAALPHAIDITRMAMEKSCPVAVETVALFTRWLGAIAGNLALTLGATGGVVLAGGILPRWGRLFDGALFRRGFEAKGRFAPYLEKVPTVLVTSGHPALLGLAALWGQARGRTASGMNQ